MDKKNIVQEYIDGSGLNALSEKYHIGKKKVRSILLDAGIELKSRGGQVKADKKVLPEEKYPHKEGYRYIAKTKDGSITFNDYLNKGGHLTAYCKKNYNIDKIPSEDYWWEEYFDIISVPIEDVKKCPYCEWTTIDVNNKSGVFEQHLKKVHNISKDNYISSHPEEKEYFTLSNLTLNRQYSNDKDDYVTCCVCGKKLSRIDNTHLSQHGMNKMDYINRYPHALLVSKNLHDKLSHITAISNQNIHRTYESKGEIEIKEFIQNNLHLTCEKNRSILKGIELDMFIPEKNCAIEYNGLYWHQEQFGKDRYYHLNKLQKCHDAGIRLIHIFEDEFVNHKELVLDKISHILQCHKGNSQTIPARKCQIRPIEGLVARSFLDKYHIQGSCKAMVYYGAYFNNNLVGVMAFSRNGDEWELSRYATIMSSKCIGLGGKLFKRFVSDYKPTYVKSFADRRWTFNSSDNMYTKIGFKLEEVLKPDYRYYNSSVDKYKRFHKFNFRKQILVKRHGFDSSMTEKEMTKQLGFDKIWDCGLYKFVWRG